VLATASASAIATETSQSSWILTITARSQGLTVSRTLQPITRPAEFDGVYTLTDPSTGLDFTSGDTTLGTLQNLSVMLIADPVVQLSFAVMAGSNDTEFTIQSGMVTIDPTYTNPNAYASAAVTVTDGNRNGATLTGLYAGGKCYQALYNDTSWTSLVDSVSAPARKSVTQEESRPVDGDWETIPGTVSSMGSGFHFSVSAGDSASGTSTFEVVPVPEPSSLIALLAGAATLGGIRLRSRK
jgi:hypothetical protein